MTALLFWAALTLMTVLAAVAIVLPLAGRRAEAAGRALVDEQVPVLAGLAQELAEIERQHADGMLAPAEAAALRASVRRRLQEEAALAAAARGGAAGGDGGTRWLAYALAASVTVGAAGLYGWMGRPDLARPDGAEGWRMLGWSRFELGDWRGSAEAYGRAVELAPDNALYLSALGEAQVMAAGGAITPAAREFFRRALAADPRDVRARYYLAAARDQDGDTRGAVEDWLRLVAEDPSAPWVAQLRPIILERARAAGVDVAGRLPPPPAAPAAPPGMLAPPSPDQVARAEAMSPEDRQAMIRGMVDGLEARLKEDPADLEGWQRLIRARMVLGEEARAKAAYAEARRAFAGRPSELRQLESFARMVNLPGA